MSKLHRTTLRKSDNASYEEEFELTDYEMRKLRFAQAKTWADAKKQVWDESLELHPYYQHYTTLSTLIGRILHQEWWATRSDFADMNDVQESRKFGSRELLRRTYQISFSHGTAESAAMWAIYSQQDPFAVRVLMPRNTIQDWVTKIQLKQGRHTKSLQLIMNGDIERPMLRDVIYAAVPYYNSKHDSLDKKRGCVIQWSEATCDFRKNKIEQGKLAEYLQDKAVSGWIKDYEWRNERESRLCVRIAKPSRRTAIPLYLPPEVIAKMSFTFSPWLTNNQEQAVQKILKDVLSVNCKILSGELRQDMVETASGGKIFKVSAKAFHRSTIEGAMNFKKEY